MGFKRGALSAITAPVVGNGNNGHHHNQVTNKNFGTASISGGIANRHPPQDSFYKNFLVLLMPQEKLNWVDYH